MAAVADSKILRCLLTILYFAEAGAFLTLSPGASSGSAHRGPLARALSGPPRLPLFRSFLVGSA